jgi:dihydrofolate reductase
MRKIIVISMITLDGVMQAPGGPKEDRSGGFKFGGWVAPYGDKLFDRVLKEELKPADYLLGRKTFEIWAPYWPDHGAFWPAINAGNKYVFSKKLKNKSPIVKSWKHSQVIHTVSEIRKLKASKGRDLQVWGSSELVHLLLKHDLVDELRLKIHPVILGKGKRLFNKDSRAAAFRMISKVITSTGVIIAIYRRAGDVSTGALGEASAV